MAESRIFRRDWILNTKPNATLILKRYPRFLDMNETIRQEFFFLVGEFKDIRNQWSLCRDTILQLAVTASEKDEDLKEELFCISPVENEFDEAKKTIVSFKALPYLLPSPPKRGKKEPRKSGKATSMRFIVELENMTVDAAVEILNLDGCKQPLIFILGSAMYIKVDLNAVLVEDADSFPEMVLLLLATFYVFDLKYPDELRVLFSLLEKICGISATIRSSIANEFFRLLNLE
ncbi:uncharacterized protein LOC136075280 [Hydra vulgaris]|uniref:Uncharacterized protein LOC136075280 n=1 Tax=Hydra vulgaris TaxID=6087 RepID=A0ABM4B574_HYDVU